MPRPSHSIGAHDRGVVAGELGDCAHRRRARPAAPTASAMCTARALADRETLWSSRSSGFGNVRRDRLDAPRRANAPACSRPSSLDQEDAELLAGEQLLAAVEDLVEHRRGVGDRAADHLQHLGGRGLLLERLLGLVEQARVLDRDHRLVGEGLQQRDLLVGERARARAANDGDRADRRALAQHRHDQSSAAAASAAAARQPCVRSVGLARRRSATTLALAGSPAPRMSPRRRGKGTTLANVLRRRRRRSAMRRPDARRRRPSG